MCQLVGVRFVVPPLSSTELSPLSHSPVLPGQPWVSLSVSQPVLLSSRDQLEVQTDHIRSSGQSVLLLAHPGL